MCFGTEGAKGSGAGGARPGWKVASWIGMAMVLALCGTASAGEADGGGLPAAASPASPANASPANASIDQPETDLPRETPIENSLGRTRSSGSAIGGYGELILNAPSNGPSVVDLRRVVLYVGHDFTESIRFYSELEVEHAVSTLGNAAEVGIEQAYLDWVQSGHFGLRGGLVLMPMGIINTYHEPPSF